MLLAALTLALPLPAPAGDGPYRRVLRAAVERAQAELVNASDLYEDHSTWERAWRAESARYVVQTTHSRYLAQDVANGLDTMFDHFRRILRSEFEPTQKLEVFILPDLAAYNDFGNEHGAEHSSFLGSFFPNGHPQRPVACMFDANPILLRMWITHSAVHQFVDRAYTRQAPVWMSEGLASYFALYWDQDYGPRELARILANAPPIDQAPAPDAGLRNAVQNLLGNQAAPSPATYVPLGQLLDAPIASYVDRSHSRLIELGMLFTYLLHFREDTRTVEEEGEIVSAPFADYLRDYLEGRDVTGTAVHALLFVDRGQLEADFRAYFAE